jgi:hypothetical protein
MMKQFLIEEIYCLYMIASLLLASYRSVDEQASQEKYNSQSATFL